MTALPWILLALGALLAYTPKWTRPDLYFAVTVDIDFSSTRRGRRILQQYWIEVALHALIAWCLASLPGIQPRWSLMVGIVWLLIGSCWAVARAHRATAQYAAAPRAVREAMLSVQPRKMPGGWLVAFGPLLVLIAAGLYAWICWDQLPQRIPVHWGLRGTDRWIDRTPWNVARFLALLACVCGTLLALSYGTLRWSRTISVTGERARGEARFRRGTVWLSLGVQYLAVIPAVVLAFRPATPLWWVWPALLLLVTAVALTVLVRMGQGGSRAADVAAYRPPIGDLTPDAAWKWGQLYYNPDDPALIVEKRFGLGYTFNFGNRWSWVLVAVLLLPVVVAMALQ
jgi:uncharacterized membrane protein